MTVKIGRRLEDTTPSVEGREAMGGRVHANFSFIDCPLLDRTTLARRDSLYALWKNNTKGTLSESQQKRITAHFRGNQFAEYLDGASREFIKQIDWQIGYDTPDQAEKVGLIISKKWVDARKRNL